MSGGSWIGPKRNGIGIGPANWKGWLCIVVLLAFATGLRVRHAPYGWLVIVVSTLSVALVWLAVAKTKSGAWRWRSGDKD